MQIKFKMNNEHYVNMLEALDFTYRLYLGDFMPIITILRRNCDKEVHIINDDEKAREIIDDFKYNAFPLFHKINSENDIINPNINIIQELKMEFLNLGEYKGKEVNVKLDMNKDEIEVLKKSLDIITRLYIGQIDELFSLLFDNTLATGERFSKSYIPGNKERAWISVLLGKIVVGKSVTEFHYGIFNPHVDNRARILYDIYKVLMYESGVKGCYCFKPTAACELALPKIKFPSEKMVVEKISDVYSFVDDIRDLHQVDSELYLNIEKLYTSIRIDIGDTIYKKYNGKYLVKKR